MITGDYGLTAERSPVASESWLPALFAL